MKTLLALTFAVALVCTTGSLFAQDNMGGNMSQGSTTATAPAKGGHIVGKISDDGKSFTADKDGKSWTIDNPDAVKGHEGHHVVLRADVNADAGSVHVNSLKMAKDSGMKNNSSM
jgi:hypothetical protein